ncbi:hypothetical protein B2G50_15795 [Leptospira interrogans serovar Canicola]|nr:hypothetical protein B2G50_15795 [Leptospira interrogans serovar Canicola]
MYGPRKRFQIFYDLKRKFEVILEEVEKIPSIKRTKSENWKVFGKRCSNLLEKLILPTFKSDLKI